MKCTWSSQLSWRRKLWFLYGLNHLNSHLSSRPHVQSCTKQTEGKLHKLADLILPFNAVLHWKNSQPPSLGGFLELISFFKHLVDEPHGCSLFKLFKKVCLAHFPNILTRELYVEIGRVKQNWAVPTLSFLSLYFHPAVRHCLHLRPWNE